MASVGRAFGFYIKYWQEMQACYEDGAKLAVSGAISKKDTQEKIKKVGDCAGKQAAALLTDCGTEICKHFNENLGCRTRVFSRQATKEKNWQIGVKLDRGAGRKSKMVRWQIGVWIAERRDGIEPTLFLWIWARGQNGKGERQAEEEIADIFGDDRAKCRSKNMGGAWGPGIVAFGEVSLKDKVGNDFDIKREDILKEVKSSLSNVGKRDVERLFQI